MHFMIGAGVGNDDSLERVREGFMQGNVTKSGYEKTCQGLTRTV